MASSSTSDKDMEKGMADALEVEDKSKIQAESPERIEEETSEEEDDSDEGGLENMAYIDDEEPLADDEITQILNDAASPTKRIVSFKPATSIRTIVPNGPLPDQEIVEVVPSTSSVPAILSEEDMEEINISEPTPAPVESAKVTYMKQKKPKNNFFGSSKLAIDLAPEPVENPENLDQRGQQRCSEDTRQKWVQCGCVVLIVIIILLLVFVKDSSNGH